MSETEEVPKQEEVMEKDESTEMKDSPDSPPPAEPKFEVADDQPWPVKDESTETKDSPDSPAPATPAEPKCEVADDQPCPVKALTEDIEEEGEEEKETEKKEEGEEGDDVKEEEGSEEEVKKEVEEEEEDEDEEEEEEKKGLFDLPVEVEGKRKRESTSFLKVEEKVYSKHRVPTFDGSGTALGEIPFILHQIDSEKKVEDLRPLYHVCFGTKGKHTMLKREVKKFNGFSFAKGSEEYKKKHAVVSKHTRADLTHVRRILGLAAGKLKEDEVQIVMDFLLNPHDEGKKVPQKTDKRKSAAKGKTPSKKAKGESAAKTSKGEEGSESGEEEKEEKEAAKKATKRKAADQTTKTASKKSKKAGSEEGEEEKKGDAHSDTASSEASERKKKEKEKEKEKKQFDPTPLEDDLKRKISDLLKTFDLTQVNMKQMVVEVCEAFPEYTNLKERTPSIKAFIKEAIRDE